MSKIICPECRTVLEHDRGFLPLHMRDTVRGQLVTGTQVCDLSNTKLITELRTVEYKHECPDCGIQTEVKITEDYPGAIEHFKPFLEQRCIGCSIPHDGFYCENPGCGVEVIDRPVFYRVSNTFDKYLPSDAKAEQWRDFDTELEASTFIETLPEHEDGRYGLDEMPAGWYDTRNSSNDCRSDDPMAPAEHQGAFKAEYHKIVLVTDGHVIHEEPEGERGDDLTDNLLDGPIEADDDTPLPGSPSLQSALAALLKEANRRG